MRVRGGGAHQGGRGVEALRVLPGALGARMLHAPPIHPADCLCVRVRGGGGDVDVDWPCKAPRSQVRKPSVYNCFIRPLILFVASRRVPGIVVERRQVWVRCAGRRGAISSDAAAAIIRTGGGLPRPVL